MIFIVHSRRDKGAVSSVKNQLNCGACWAFSTIATIESMKAIQTGNLTEFSVQQVHEEEMCYLLLSY